VDFRAHRVDRATFTVASAIADRSLAAVQISSDFGTTKQNLTFRKEIIGQVNKPADFRAHSVDCVTLSIDGAIGDLSLLALQVSSNFDTTEPNSTFCRKASGQKHGPADFCAYRVDRASLAVAGAIDDLPVAAVQISSDFGTTQPNPAFGKEFISQANEPADLRT
jgi:hypothetical protein